ncbi:MAG: hypothetical protein JWQ90_4445 [Hydrocarboniphaga sp.]|uniref:SDR family NAD(P)-dependent oxidoreductase n=1 Tax=Hydrocarboniphaga sp. TaxID=2033016 RepID=UPI002624451E|nr:SDR family NAD(P)-dependent oxidoreductase [Hydrocarboniphaga sp.]MDB5971995.1 hypothetical protein [Hydrocarboniphaga sp.]
MNDIGAASSVSLSRLLRSGLVRPRLATPVHLDGKRIIVTGASPGSIGFETAKALAQWGAEVTVTTRAQPEALATVLSDAARRPIDAITLDLCDAATVERFVATYRQRHGERLDVLINNAGVHLDLLSKWKQPRRSADGFEIHWRSNYLGTMHLTHRLLPLLCSAAAASGDARIVNLVSQLHTRGRNDQLFERTRPYHSWAAYGLSKLALIHAGFEIQRRYAQRSQLQAYCLHPGAVLTDIASKGLAGHPRVEALRKALRPIEAFFLLTAAEGAQTSLHCATRPGLAGGLYYRNCQAAKPSADSEDAAVAARLWDATASWSQAVGAPYQARYQK